MVLHTHTRTHTHACEYSTRHLANTACMGPTYEAFVLGITLICFPKVFEPFF